MSHNSINVIRQTDAQSDMPVNSGLPKFYSNARMVAIILFLTVIILFFAAIHILYPSLPVDATILGLLALLVFVWLFPFIKELALPGGIKITMAETLPLQRSVERIRETVAPEIGPRVVEAAEPAWRIQMSLNPREGLISLRNEIVTRLFELGKRFYPESPSLRYHGSTAVTNLIWDLRAREMLTADEERAIQEVLSISNTVIHGGEIEAGAMRTVADSGVFLLGLLDSKITPPKPER